MQGYWQQPEKTAEAIRNGWYHSGDAGYVDEEGFLYIKDRIKDMVVSGGENIYPAEIEAVLYKHPAVHMCAVIGIPDAKWGGVGKACVILKPDETVTEDELITFMQENLARYKVPKSVTFMTQFPISGARKILKRTLREQFI